MSAREEFARRRIEEMTRRVFALLPLVVANRCHLAGGALRAAIDGTAVKDYDLFFPSVDDYLLAVEAMELIPGVTRVDAPPQTSGFRLPSGELFNLVGFRFYNDPWSIAQAMDFRCCGIAAWAYDAHLAPDTAFVSLSISPGAIDDCFDRVLVPQVNQPDTRVLSRIARYEAYGYHMHPDFASLRAAAPVDNCSTTY